MRVAGAILCLVAMTSSAREFPDVDQLPPYFPSQREPDAKNPQRRFEWSSAAELAHLGEPSICCHRDPPREFRFTWLRTFDPAVVVRITELPDHTWRLNLKMGSGQSGFDFFSTRVVRDETRLVAAKDMTALLTSFSAGAPFWSVPETTDRNGLDGAGWLIEGRTGDRYHYAWRWSPESGEVRELGLRFLAVAGLGKERVY